MLAIQKTGISLLLSLMASSAGLMGLPVVPASAPHAVKVVRRQAPPKPPAKAAARLMPARHNAGRR